MSTNMPVELFTDGSALKNPGPSGLGYVIRYYENTGDNQMPVQKDLEGNQGFRLSTNNRMEIMAGIFGLRRIFEEIDKGTLQGTPQINLSSDSEYFVNAVNKHWIDKWQQHNWMTSPWQGKPGHAVSNKDLWEQFIECQNEVKKRGINLTMTHVNGHSGLELNERADRLAVAASSDSSNHKIDEEYEKTSPYLNRSSSFSNYKPGNYNG